MGKRIIYIPLAKKYWGIGRFLRIVHIYEGFSDIEIPSFTNRAPVPLEAFGYLPTPREKRRWRELLESCADRPLRFARPFRVFVMWEGDEELLT